MFFWKWFVENLVHTFYSRKWLLNRSTRTPHSPTRLQQTQATGHTEIIILVDGKDLMGTEQNSGYMSTHTHNCHVHSIIIKQKKNVPPSPPDKCPIQFWFSNLEMGVVWKLKLKISIQQAHNCPSIYSKAWKVRLIPCQHSPSSKVPHLCFVFGFFLHILFVVVDVHFFDEKKCKWETFSRYHLKLAKHIAFEHS